MIFSFDKLSIWYEPVS